jgi:enoyl-CoA hydratase
MIDTKIVDSIAVVTLRHGKVNALDIEFCEALAAKFKELAALPDAKAVVLTGQGKAFSAGVNLLRLSEGGADYVRQFMPSLHKFFEAVFFHPKPVVAAVNGHAIAGGCVLAACADRRIMGRGAGRIGVTELLVGVPFPVLAFEIVRAAVPTRYLSEVLYSGATYEPDAALERGFIDEIAEPAELLQDAYAVAQELAALSPAAFAQTKAQIRQSAAERVAAGAAAEKAATDIWAAPETLSYIRAYVGDDIFLVLQPDRQPHHVGAGAGLHLLRVRQLPVRGGCGVNDERTGIADVREVREQFDIGDELDAGVIAALESEGEHGAAALRHVFLRQRVVLVVLETRIAHPGHFRPLRQPFRDIERIVTMALHAQ